MKLELGWQSYGLNEVKEVQDSLNTGMLTMGAKVARFERMFAEYTGTRNAIMVNSGSSANLLAVAALVETGILKPGMVIPVPALTWCTTLWPIVQCGLQAELMDCDLKTLQVPPMLHGRCFAAHIMGNAAQEHAVLEDCCEALGTRIAGRHVGAVAVAATFSFYFSHHMTTVEGGMVTCYDDDFADVLRSMRSHGWTRHTRMEGIPYAGIDPRFLFIHPGYNFRPTEMNAAFGIHQLPRVEGWNAKRRQVYAEMRRRLEPFGLFDFIEATPNSDPAWFSFPVLVRNGKRNAVMNHLESMGVQTRPIIAGNLARHPAISVRSDIIHGPLPNADRVMDDGVYWGCHPGVDDAQIEYLVQAVESFAEKREAA